jgi:hypothetical protein
VSQVTAGCEGFPYPSQMARPNKPGFMNKNGQVLLREPEEHAIAAARQTCLIASVRSARSMSGQAKLADTF